MKTDVIINRDALYALRELPSESVNCCVTSPPYYGLRDYGLDAQIGREDTPEQYIGRLVEVFRELRRVLKDDGTFWLNIADTYCGSGMKAGCKQKDLIGIPWLLAFALRSDGWYLRSDIIWLKENPIPESCRDGAIAENQTTGDTERISNRIRDADLQKTPEQQAAQDAMQLPPVSDTSPLPHVPGAAPKADTGKTERVMKHIDAAHTRKASKKAVRKAQAEATAGTKSSRLQFTDEERAAPELEKYIKKSDKAADRLDKAKAAIPKEKKLVKERTFDETTGKGKTRLHFEEKDKPPGFKEKHNPLSRPTQEAGILVHNKIHSVEKDNSGVEGAHKSEEAAERGLKYGARKIKQGYRSHKLKPYREAAKAEKAAFRANVDFQYHKTLHENPQLTSNPISRFWQKQKIKRQYAKEARNTAKGIKGAAERTRKAAAKAAEKTKQTAAFVARHPAGVAIAVGVLLLFIMVMSGLSSCGAMFSGTLNGVRGKT